MVYLTKESTYEITREAVLDMWDLMWAAYGTEKEEKKEEKEVTNGKRSN